MNGIARIPAGAFAFGKNWLAFLKIVDEARIRAAEESLKRLLGVESLQDRRFLDIGCGSGLFSLAACRLGARVHSFDYDPDAVACAREMKSRYSSQRSDWTIEQGSALDKTYMHTLGKFDVVYSWGVLHHTGSLWEALDNAAIPVMPGGSLCVAIYNDQGGASLRWARIKRLYHRSPAPLRFLLVLIIGAFFEFRFAVIRAMKLENPLPFREWRDRKKSRGMSVWHDLVDWVGGYPFEVAKPELIFDFYRQRGFELTRLKTLGGNSGCNEYVFRKILL